MMINKIFPHLVLVCLMGFSISTPGQKNDQNEVDSIILRALKDEIYRNLNELIDKDSANPFFISYAYLDGEVTEASAILGALLNSNQFSNSSWSIRLMVGDYNLNDENFQDNFSKDNYEPDFIRREPLIEPDYIGIRKFFWWNSSEIFRSAVKSYKGKLAALKDKPITSEEEQLPDYTKADPVIIHKHGSILPVQKENMELFVKDISDVFREYKDVYSSNASVYIFSSTMYIINTEGSEIRIPLNIALVNVSAKIHSSKGEVLSSSFSYISSGLSGIPPADTIKKAARTLTDYLLNLKKAEVINEVYTGPVLYQNDGAVQIFSQCLFGMERPLVAEREPLVNSLSKSMTPKNGYSKESKIDKRIISKDITVKASPHLKEFKGIPLMGSFDVDAECIVPPDEILLIDKGYLKTMFCDRIPTKKIKQSNGHNRIGLSYGGFYAGIAPGVILVESENKKQISELRDQMIEIAKEKGLEYVFFVKPLLGRECIGPLCFYKIDVATNKEELVYHMSVSDLELKTLNKIAGCGDGTFVQNLVFNGTGFHNRSGKSGFPASFVVPDALLIEEMELTPMFPYSEMDSPLYDEYQEE